MMPQKYRFAVLGLGHIGQRHLKVLQQIEHIELVACADVFHEMPAQLLHLSLPYYNDLNALLTSLHKPDVLCICTPNGLHAPQAITAMEAGCHVVVEKPLALTLSSALQMMQVAAATGKKLFGVMQLRHVPAVKLLHQLINTQQLGNIYMVSVVAFWNRDDRYYQPSSWHGTKDLDGGVLFTQFSHFVDMLCWLLGPPINISSKLINAAHRHSTQLDYDGGSIHFSFPNHPFAIGTFQFTTAAPKNNVESSLTIIAEKGTFRLSGQYLDQWNNSAFENEDKLPIVEKITPEICHQLWLEDVITALQNNAPIDQTQLDTIKVLELMGTLEK